MLIHPDWQSHFFAQTFICGHCVKPSSPYVLEVCLHLKDKNVNNNQICRICGYEQVLATSPLLCYDWNSEKPSETLWRNRE